MQIINIIGIAGLFVAIAVFVQNMQLERKIKSSLQLYKKNTQDTAQLIESFVNFKTSFDFALDAMLIADPDGKVIYCNRRFSQITGFSQSEIMNAKAGTLWGKQMDTKFYENLWQTIKVEKKPFVGIITNKKKSGEKYQANVRIVPILDEKKEHALYFVSIEHEV